MEPIGGVTSIGRAKRTRGHRLCGKSIQCERPADRTGGLSAWRHDGIADRDARRRAVSDAMKKQTARPVQRRLQRPTSSDDQSARTNDSNKAPSRQRRPRDPRAQNGAIGDGSHHEEKERPRIRRAVSTSTGLLASPTRSVRRLRKEASSTAVAMVDPVDQNSASNSNCNRCY